MQNLAINAERLWGEIMETAAIGGTPKGGICRLTLTELDRQVRDWFKARAEQLGCRVTVDDMGVMFARRDGTANVPPIAFGSHLDTQPTGGKFDGVLGTLAALEALRTLVEAGYETYAPIEVVNWTNEEGSRFAPAMVASGVFAKVLEKDWAQSRQDRDGMTFAAALDAIELHYAHGYLAHSFLSPVSNHRTDQYGGSLENRTRFGLEIAKAVRTAVPKGIALGARITGSDWRDDGLSTHDAVTYSIALKAAGLDYIDVSSGGITADARNPSANFRAALPAICEPLGLGVAMQRIWEQPELRFDADCVAAVRRAAELSGYSSRDIVSGAGHDAAHISRVAPAAMVFVPCRGGISHNEAEFSSKEQCAKGAQVLLQAVLDYDRMLAERGGAAKGAR